MKIVCTSDLHENFVDFLPAGDVLCIAGDITLQPRNAYANQQRIINGPFAAWCESLLDAGTYKKIVWIAGNHDKFIENWGQSAIEIDHPDIIYLQDSGCEIDGVKFWGTPWQAPFCGWGFNAKLGRRQGKFRLIPEGIDVLLSHAPPMVGDLGRCADGYNAGDEALRDAIERASPKYCICGHIHEGVGENKIESTTVYNCSLVTLRYTVREDSFRIIEV